ncbi:hypothetical protein Q011_06124 [Pseudomonas aeruginosa 6077]|nr:hypothetical protein Q011_06124 [Pseudomonas aeruginosa 6077]
MTRTIGMQMTMAIFRNDITIGSAWRTISIAGK